MFANKLKYLVSCYQKQDWVQIIIKKSYQQTWVMTKLRETDYVYNIGR